MQPDQHVGAAVRLDLAREAVVLLGAAAADGGDAAQSEDLGEAALEVVQRVRRPLAPGLALLPYFLMCRKGLCGNCRRV